MSYFDFYRDSPFELCGSTKPNIKYQISEIKSNFLKIFCEVVLRMYIAANIISA